MAETSPIDRCRSKRRGQGRGILQGHKRKNTSIKDVSKRTQGRGEESTRKVFCVPTLLVTPGHLGHCLTQGNSSTHLLSGYSCGWCCGSCGDIKLLAAAAVAMRPDWLPLSVGGDNRHPRQGSLGETVLSQALESYTGRM